MNKSAVSDSGAVAKKRPATTRLTGKRTHSASPLRPVQTADAAKKGKRRCSSYSPPDFSKGAQGNVPAKAKIVTKTDSSHLSLSDSFHSPDFNLTNEGGSGGKNAKDCPQSAKTKLQKGLSVKKREYLKLRKSLLPQQNMMIEMYACIRDLEQRMGNPADNIGDLRVISVTSWPPHDLLMLIQEDLHFPTNDISGIIGPQVLQHLFAQLSPMPDEVLQMGAQLMAKRIDLINILRKCRSERAYTNTQDFKARNSEQDQETERLNRLVAGTADNIKAKINYCLELAKVPWLDRDRYLKKLDRLKADNQVLLRKLEEAEENFSSDGVSNSKDVHIQEELAKERAAREASKEVVAAAENMLRVARARISSLERQLKESKAEVDAAHRKQKELEQLYRHRETSYDVRSKKLMEVSKTGEMTIDVLSRQRDALELRVKELHEQIDMADKMKQATEAEQRLKIDSLQSKLADQEKKKVEAEVAVADLKVKVKDMEDVIHNLRERSGALVDLERKRCLEYLPKKESEPSQRETQLWRELQIVRLNLSRAEEELHQSRADKEDFLASLSKIAQEGAENLQEKMATVLLEKERKITKLQQVIDEHRENEKSMEQSMTEYEDQLASLRLHVKRLSNYDCYSKEEHSYPELETELLEMSMRVEELTRERSALESAAASRALMLERHERAADLFARVTRARRDLATALEGGQEPPPPIKDIPPEASRSLSSVCVSAMETWSALRAERARVLQLEGAVRAQGLQLEREGRVRMHLEQRRALLERELLRTHSSTAYESACNVNPISI